jgi:hypothetical protein
MATLYWRGTVDGDIGDKNNYVTAAGATPGSNPANDDTLIFDYGSVDVDAGLTSGLTGITLIGTPGYTGRIGPSSPLSIALDDLRWQDSGSLNITGDITAGKVRCRRGSSFVYAGGTATTLYIEGTSYLIEAAAVVTTGRYVSSNGSDLNNGTGYTTCEVIGGTHVSRRAGKFVVRDGGRVKAGVGCSLSAGTEVTNGAMINYASGETISGVVNVLPGGMFDASDSESFTFSGTLNQWPNASVDLFTSGGEVTPSTLNYIGLGKSVASFSNQSTGVVQ